MSKTNDTNKIKNILITSVIVALCVVMAVLQFVSVTYTQDELWNGLISRIVQQTCGIVAVVLVLYTMKIKLFGKPQQWLYLLPCIICAVNNFQFWSYFSGKMHLVRNQALDIIFFSVYCLSIGMFEEFVFRGVLFSVIAGYFTKDKKGLVKTFVVSSVIFGLSHLFNLFAGGGVGATIMQVGYTTLTGGLFAFVLIKTKNLLCCGFVHALYNFCGLIMETPNSLGLGSGVVFDLGTGLTMAAVAVCVAAFVLYSLYKYTEAERSILYKRLGIKEKPTEQSNISDKETEIGE